MTLTVVMNLCTAKKVSYTLAPREAVIAAHAQSLGDFNTWDYEKRYGSMIERGHETILCGDHTAFYKCIKCGREEDLVASQYDPVELTAFCADCAKKHDAALLERRQAWLDQQKQKEKNHA